MSMYGKNHYNIVISLQLIKIKKLKKKKKWEAKGTTEDEMIGWHHHPGVWVDSGSW